MRLREAAIILVLALGLLAAPLAAEAQQAGKVYRVGYLQTSAREQQLHLIRAFEEGLRDLGYGVGQNVVIEYRFAEARPERLPELAADLVRLGVHPIWTAHRGDVKCSGGCSARLIGGARASSGSPGRPRSG